MIVTLHLYVRVSTFISSLSSSIHFSIYLIRSGDGRFSSSLLPRWALFSHRSKERGQLKSCVQRTEIQSTSRECGGWGMPLWAALPRHQTLVCRCRCSVARDSRYSIVDAIRHQHPPLKLVRIKAFLEALTESKPQGSKKAQSLIEQFVFLMLFIDLQRYERRGAGVIKPGLNKKALVNLANAYFQSQGSNTTPKEKKSVTSKSFAELWEYVKSATLQQCVVLQCRRRHDIVLDSMEMQLIRMPNPKQGRGGNRFFVWTHTG